MQKDKSQFTFQGAHCACPATLRCATLRCAVLRCAVLCCVPPLLPRRASLTSSGDKRNRQSPQPSTTQGCPQPSLHCLPHPVAAGEAEGSYAHSSRWVSTAACNVQTIGRDVLYTPRIETRFKTGACAAAAGAARRSNMRLPLLGRAWLRRWLGALWEPGKPNAA